MSILTLDDAKAHARVTISDDDTLIQSLIDAAEAHLSNYLGVADLTTLIPSGGVYPPELLLAEKQLVGFWYDNREGDPLPDGIKQKLIDMQWSV